MNDYEFRAFLNLLMCSDPWPCDEESRVTLSDFATTEAVRRGFQDWFSAYHHFQPVVAT